MKHTRADIRTGQSCGVHSAASFEQVTSSRKGANLAIGNCALEHPEPTIRVDIFDAARSNGPLRAFNHPRDLIGAFDHGRLDVDDTETEADLWTQIAEN
jgi:hypothetical protein